MRWPTGAFFREAKSRLFFDGELLIASKIAWCAEIPLASRCHAGRAGIYLIG